MKKVLSLIVALVLLFSCFLFVNQENVDAMIVSANIGAVYGYRPTVFPNVPFVRPVYTPVVTVASAPILGVPARPYHVPGQYYTTTYSQAFNYAVNQEFTQNACGQLEWSGNIPVVEYGHPYNYYTPYVPAWTPYNWVIVGP